MKLRVSVKAKPGQVERPLGRPHCHVPKPADTGPDEMGWELLSVVWGDLGCWERRRAVSMGRKAAALGRGEGRSLLQLFLV